MKITRGDQIEIGDRVLVNGEPFIAYRVSNGGVFFRGDHPDYTHQDYRIPVSWKYENEPGLNIKLNTNPTTSQAQQDPVKVESESGKLS